VRSRVLLVDSEAIVDPSLGGLDIELSRSSRGTAALELLCEQEVAVAVVALALPDMSGIELARLIHGDYTQRHMPILLLATNEEWEEVAYRAHEAGVVDFVPRPLRRGLVRSKLMVHLELHQSRLRERERTAQLELSNQELHDFAHAAAHDLSAPLRSIKARSIALQDANMEFEERVRTVNSMAGSIARMEKMLTQMLDYAKVERTAHVQEAVDLNACIRDVFADLQAQIAESRATVTADVLPIVSGHRGQLSRLFQNIIGNAIKYSRPGVPSVVHISSTLEGSSAEVKVEDNGIGFDMKLHDEVFKPFRRLVSVQSGGSGIGMAIAKRIVERHAGTIHATSSIGQGTTFYVRLPVSAQEIAAYRRLLAAGPTRVTANAAPAAGASSRRPEAARPLARPSRVQPRVLVVDDSEEERNNVVQALGKDCEVIIADSAEAAVLLLSTDLTAVLSDYNMNGQSGVWLLGQVAERMRDVRRVLITACPDDRCSAALEAGVVETLFAKPAPVSDLRRLLGLVD
jgi:signal transduction histidine kinase